MDSVSTFSENNSEFLVYPLFDTIHEQRDAVIGVQQSTDGGSNWTDLFNNAKDSMICVTRPRSQLYCNIFAQYYTHANYRYRMMMYVNTDQIEFNHLGFKCTELLVVVQF